AAEGETYIEAPQPVQPEERCGVECELHLVAVPPRFGHRKDRPNLEVMEAGEMGEALADDMLFRGELRRIVQVLPDASAAGAEERARGRGALFPGRLDRHQV